MIQNVEKGTVPFSTFLYFCGMMWTLLLASSIVFQPGDDGAELKERDYGFRTVIEADVKKVTAQLGSGDYSGITYLGGSRYAVVDDKRSGGGILLVDMDVSFKGKVGGVSVAIPEGTASSDIKKRDNEGVAYVAGGIGPGTLFVSAEADQSIREYGLDGVPTGRVMAVPDDMARSKIKSNRGFEALTYNEFTGLFWTTTEDALLEDASLDAGLLRLQSFGTDLKPAGRFLYQMDEPVKSEAEAAGAESYVFGVPAMTALDDGRLIVLEREVYVPKGGNISKLRKSFTRMNLYVVNPASDGESEVLRKTLMCSFTTKPTSGRFADYEGMCLGPLVPDGGRTLILISDSQHGAGGVARDFVKVIVFR
jgi:hypothetical protein